MERLIQQKTTGKRSIVQLLLVFVCFFYHPFLYAQQQEKVNLNIVFIGNSITHGAGLKDFKTMAPPVFTTKFLREQPQIGQVDFNNQGRSGFTTVDFLPDTLRIYTKEEQDRNTLDAAFADFTFLPNTGSAFNQAERYAQLFNHNIRAQLIFSIDLGTNDSAISGPKGAPVTAEDYQHNLRTIADSLMRDFPKCKIVFQHPLWYSTNTYNHSKYLAEGLARLNSYFPKIDELIKSYKKANPKQVFLGDKKGFAYFKKHHEELMQHENGKQGVYYLHPNAKGAEALGVLWGKAIFKVVKRSNN